MKLKTIELFGGIGACSKALERLNIDHTIVDYVEIDKYTVKSYNAIHNSNFEPQDITQWDKDIEVDLIMHGSPCQDFSLAGKQNGGDEGSGTRSSLMYETIRIVKKLKPKYVIWENVKNVLSQKHRHNFDNYLSEMEKLGYTNYYQVLNAKDYGIPQNRERVFTVSILDNYTEKYEKISVIGKDFKFPLKQDLKLRLKDMLEDEVDEKYYLSDKMLKGMMNTNFEQYKLENKLKDTNGNADTIVARFDGCPQLVKDKVLVKEATKKGYKEAYEGDSINLEQPNSQTRRGRVGNQVAQTLTTSCNQSVVTKVIGSTQKNAYIGNGDESPSLTSAMGMGGGHVPMLEFNNLRIRKLTPLETWRLMGFDDEDFEKASKVNSNAQLYKQAGNSIVVNVLEAILTNLLK